MREAVFVYFLITELARMGPLCFCHWQYINHLSNNCCMGVLLLSKNISAVITKNSWKLHKDSLKDHPEHTFLLSFITDGSSLFAILKQQLKTS